MTPPNHRNQRPHSTAREYLEALLVAGLFLTFTNTWILKTFYIPSGSMLNTLLVGDHLIVNRFVFADLRQDEPEPLLPQRPIQRGDIVVFRSPLDPKIDLVKRCIGLPGDTIAVREKRLLVNGETIDEPYVIHRDPRVGGLSSFGPDILRRDMFGPYRVPQDHYFCLGDNRDESLDSRFWGPLPTKYVKGRPVVVYWSYSGNPPPTDGSSSRHLRHLLSTAAGFFTKTRWQRTFSSPR